MSDLKFAIEKLKAKIQLPQIVGEVVTLSQKAGRHLGLCPFHNEKTPSFYVFDSSYHCFGCGEHGDAIEFIKKTRSLSFIESLEFLSEKYRIEMPELKSPQSNARTNKLKDYYRAFIVAQNLFTRNLHSSSDNESANNALNYLKKRGFSDEKIKEFGFGLSINSYNQLTQELQKNSIDPKIAYELELLRPSKKKAGESYDFFRNRLMIPIRDKQGRIIAFGGRTLNNDPIKYVNSPNHPLFNKKNILYGLDFAKNSIGRKKRVFVAEGYMDVLQLWQQGIDESVAVLGTALSTEHLRMLEHLSPTVYLIFDGDSAGVKASLRTVSISLEFPKIQIKVINLPSDQDPDTYIKSHTLDDFERLVKQSQNLLHFVLQTELKEVPTLSVPDYIRKTVMPWIEQLSDPMQKNILLGEVSKISGIDQDKLVSLVEKSRPISSDNHSGSKALYSDPSGDRSASSATNSQELPERGFLELMGHLFFANPSEMKLDDLAKIMSNLEASQPWQDGLQKLVALLKLGARPSDIAADKLSLTFTGLDVQLNFLESLRKKEGAFETSNRKQSVELVLRTLENRKKTSGLKDLKLELARVQASEPVDKAQIARIMKQIEQLANLAT